MGEKGLWGCVLGAAVCRNNRTGKGVGRLISASSNLSAGFQAASPSALYDLIPRSRSSSNEPYGAKVIKGKRKKKSVNKTVSVLIQTEAKKGKKR